MITFLLIFIILLLCPFLQRVLGAQPIAQMSRMAQRQ
jgi:hypothetical protein